MQCWYSNACKIAHGIVASEGCEFVLKYVSFRTCKHKSSKYQIYNGIKLNFHLIGLFSI